MSSATKPGDRCCISFKSLRRSLIPGILRSVKPEFTIIPDLLSFNMDGKTSQEVKAITLPSKPFCLFMYSSKLVLGFGILSFELTRGSGKPVNNSLYPG